MIKAKAGAAPVRDGRRMLQEADLALSDVLPKKLIHEGKQIGWIFVCPNCGTEENIPIAGHEQNQKWDVPPTNVHGGWWLQLEGEPHSFKKLKLSPDLNCKVPGCGVSLQVLDGTVFQRA